MASPPSRLPRPWRAEGIDGGYVVRDANGIALAYVWGGETRSYSQTPSLTIDQARRVATHIARMPELIAFHDAVRQALGPLKET